MAPRGRSAAPRRPSCHKGSPMHRAGRELGPSYQIDGVGRRRHRGPLVADVRHVDAHHEAHRVQPADQAGCLPRLDMRPERRTVVVARHRVLDVALRRQDQGRGLLVRRQRGQVLGRQRVQPAEPVSAGDTHHAAVRQVDHARAGQQRPLLAERVAVVSRDVRVDTVSRYGAWQRQEGAWRGCRHPAHRWHSPNTVRWPRSGVKPVRSWMVSTSEPRSPSSSSDTAPHRWQTT